MVNVVYDRRNVAKATASGLRLELTFNAVLRKVHALFDVYMFI